MRLPDLSKMNDAQRQAVIHGEGPMLVLAGPGSGKTFTITNRISWLITNHQVQPEHILVITFTRDAALSMQERFMQQRLILSSAKSGSTGKRMDSSLSSDREKQYLPVNFGTFHAIFYQIIQQSGGSAADCLMKDSEKTKLIIPIIIDFKKKTEKLRPDSGAAFGEEYEDAAKLLAAISYYKNTGESKKAAGLLEEPWRSEFDGLFRAYEKVRKRNGKLDFDDMVYGCLKLLGENRKLLDSWRQRFQYILIDEFQDINPVQYQVIRLLSEPARNLFCVGDDDQSIYGFRGSDPSLMRRFLQDYPEARQVFLNINYRSQAEIVEASRKVVSVNRNRFSKELRAAATQKSKKNDSYEEAMKLNQFPDKEQQQEYLHRKLLRHMERGTLEQCAVLFRTNAQMQGFAAALMKAGIPCYMKEKGTCIYDHFIVKDLIHYMEFAAGRRTRNLFLTIMNKPSRYISRESLTEETIDFIRLREYYRQYTSSGRLPAMLERIGKLERDLARLKNLSPYLGIEFLCKGIGYETYLRQKAGVHKDKEKEWLEIIAWLRQDARGYHSLQDWLTAQDAFREECLQLNAVKKTEGKGVRLMTVHASKGLEFDFVFIPDVNEGVYPHGRMVSPDAAQEECRMLYVAMTRAKKALELLFVTGTKERPELPSRYLNPLL